MRLPAELILAGLMLGSCAVVPPPQSAATEAFPAHLPKASRVPVSDDVVKTGQRYSVGGATYTPHDGATHEETGYASWYGEELRGKRTANGEKFDPDGISAAHRTLPMPSYVEVTALDTGKTILVRVNDRGPFHSNRVMDLSLGAARQLGLTGGGARLVRLRRVDPPAEDKLALRMGRATPSRSQAGDELEKLRRRAEWTPPRNAASARMPLGAGPFYLQVATFGSRDRARTLAGVVGGTVDASRGTYRVRTGPYFSAAKAKAALAPLAMKGYPEAMITR
jgi:rare lipoprotein A